ncbi:MAG: NADH-quinone oxidoreductase subunit M [Verrucomicrobia bacterium]|nr:NADH-quinone oxidoreductase subunit M [Verrucomicrobiota bacterium]
MSILTFILFLPLLGAGLVALLPKTAKGLIRAVALASTALPLLCAILAFLSFNGAEAGPGGYKFYQKVAWVTALDINYQVGADGINIGLILMGSIVSFAAVCVARSIQDRTKEFHFLMLIMIAGIMGTFMSIDIFFFYFFHELALVPTFIMIGVWGRGKNKDYATYKMTLYLTLGALVALVGLVLLYVQSGAKTFDLIALQEQLRDNPISSDAQTTIFGFLLFGFGILVSLWPFHTWAPVGYDAAPTATAMLHAGVLKKFGIYGLIRIALPLVPQGAQAWLEVLAWLCMGNILYCGWVAMRQKNLNKLIGNSSVAHMGFVFLGIASMNLIGISGAVLVMIAHGFLAALSFGLSGYLYDQKKTLDMDQYGGALRQMPFMGTLLVMAMMAGCGLPGFANFAGEITVLFGAWKSLPWFVTGTAWGALIIGAIYALRAVRKMLHGPVANDTPPLQDAANYWIKLPYVLLVASLLLFGIFPSLLTDKIRTSVAEVVKSIEAGTQDQETNLAEESVKTELDIQLAGQD